VVAASLGLHLTLLPEEFSICRLPAGSESPAWALADGQAPAEGLTSVSWTVNETSVVCASARVPQGTHADSGWRALEVDGPLDLATTGVLASVADPLAKAGIAIFAISTFDTDYLLVKDSAMSAAIDALREAGHQVT
jgi:hypothetical protein